jgi:hypothetical protein
MKRLIKLVGVVFVFLCIQGCATMTDSIAAKGSGQYRVYDKSFDEVWEAVIGIVRGTQLSLVNKNKQTGQILAQQGFSAFSYGENVAIFIERIGSELRTRVEVVSKKVMATNVFARNWETHIFKKLDLKLKQDITKASSGLP